MPSLSGAEITIRLLERQGIETIAGIPGGANLPLYDALSGSNKIRHVLTRHEQGAGFIAQGMSRVTGLPQVCFATSGPGATNILTAVADAKLDSIPVICITGQVPQAMIGTDAFQEVDTYGMTIPITKHNFLVRSAEELLTVIPMAFRIAASGRPGPVVVDIPKDVQCEKIAVDHWPEPGQKEPAPEFENGSLQRAAALLNASRRPVLYIGGGVIHSGASELITALSEKASIPTTMTLMGLGALPVDHPLSIGMLGMHAARYTNMIIEECDLLIAVGVRFDDRATGKVAEFCPDARVIHIDIDNSELHKIRQAHLGIVGDVTGVLTSLLPLVKENRRDKWLNQVEKLRLKHPLRMRDIDDPTTPYGLILKVAELAGDDAIVTTDVGQHQMRVAQFYPFRRARRWLTSGGLGTMGFGLPAAIGAALADPGCTVVCFTGDGSLMMNIQELATLVEQNINVKIVLLNNNALGLVHQQQNLFYGGRTFASGFEGQIDFITIARGFGLPTFDMAGSEDPVQQLELAFQHSGPCLIHVPIDVDEHVYPMVQPGGSNREMIEGENYVAE